MAKDVVLIGAAFLDGAAPKSKQNVKGYVHAFDVRTGKRPWIFHTIPTKGEFGYDTWLNHSAEYTGNAGVWAQITVDEERNRRDLAAGAAERVSDDLHARRQTVSRCGCERWVLLGEYVAFTLPSE